MINRVKAAWKFITSPNYSRTVSILALLVVVLAIPLTVFIAQKQQEIRQRAATTCPDTYDGLTFASQTQEVKNLFGNDEQAWIQAHNAELTQNPPRATDGQSLFDQPCNIITSFYAVHGSNAPQQWVNERNAAIGAPAPTATPAAAAHQAFEPCPSSTACGVTSPNIAAPNDPSQNLYCRKIGSSTNEEFEWVTQHYADAQCSATQIGRTAECSSTTYYCDGRPGGWTTTRPGPTSTPTLTPTPTPVAICGLECKSFQEGSLTDPSSCSGIEQYVHRVYYSGPGGSPPQQCKFTCNQLDSGYRQKSGGCEQEPIPVPTTPPSGNGGDGGGNGGAPAPGPGAPAPTTPPTGALTKLLFDLILSGGSKDKRIVAQIFPATPTPPAQIGQDLEGTVKRGPGGNFTGTVDVVNSITSGTYDIKVKAAKYLRKLIRNVQITQDTTNRISQTTLVLGDINGDNRINISDYNILIDCFGERAGSQKCGNNNKDLADLDDNGRVDGVDYNLFLRSLSAGPRDGD